MSLPSTLPWALPKPFWMQQLLSTWLSASVLSSMDGLKINTLRPFPPITTSTPCSHKLGAILLQHHRPLLPNPRPPSDARDVSRNAPHLRLFPRGPTPRFLPTNLYSSPHTVSLRLSAHAHQRQGENNQVPLPYQGEMMSKVYLEARTNPHSVLQNTC